MKRFMVAGFLLFVLAGTALARNLSGKEAASYIGNLEERLKSNTYHVVLLKRRDYDPRTHAEFDGIVFTRFADKYHYIRRLDDDHRLRLSAVRGDIALIASPQESARYDSLIKKNKLYPQVILDNDSQELLIIFCATQESITWSRDKKDEILLEVRDVFKNDDIKESLNNLIFSGRN